MSNSNANHSQDTGEKPYDRPLGEDLTIKVYPPIACRDLRRGGGGRRSACYSRHQLIFLMVDDSSSMRGPKAIAATEAVCELIYQCKMKSNGESIFDVSVQWFGDHVFSDVQILLTPVLEFDEDQIEFSGTSGGTRIKRAVQYIINFIALYDKENLAFNEEKDRVPPPLIIFLSDGKNGDGNPLPLAKMLTTTPLSIGVPPILITVGIEFDGGEPDVELLTEMASETEHGQKLYFDIASASQLVDLLATGGSSGATTPDELYQSIVQSNAWQKQLPNPEA